MLLNVTVLILTLITTGTTVHSFVGNYYFCDTGNPGPGTSGTVYYPDNPLCDGEGVVLLTPAVHSTTLHVFFCKTLEHPTSDDIKLRICGNLPPRIAKDVIISLIDILCT